MFTCILGTGGSGKTAEILRRAAEMSQTTETILLVPEQNSFDTERTVYEQEETKKIQVYSFTRLCHQIFRTCGGLAGTRLDDSGRRMLMAAALVQVKDRLTLYRRVASRPEFAVRMTQAADELKNAGITPEHLWELCGNDRSAQAEKLRELAEIYTVWQALIDRQGQDSRDDLLRAAKLAREQEFFRDKAVFADGFKDFTGAQDELLRVILRQSPCFTVALCADSLSGEDLLFSSCRQTAQQWIREAREAGVEVKTPTTLTRSVRYRAEALRTVEENFLRADAQSEDLPTDAVELYAARDAGEELAYGAARVRRLVMEEGFRWREIAVVSRTLPDTAVLRETFERYGVPLYLDAVEQIRNKPLPKLLSALFASTRGNDLSPVFSMLKSPLSPFSPEDVHALENYCFVWDLKRADFAHPFVRHPDGFKKTSDKKDEETLEKLNAVRESVWNRISEFSESAADCDGKAFAEAMFRFLTDFGAVEKIRRLTETLPPEEAHDCAAVYRTVVGCMEQMASVLKEVSFDLTRMAALFEAALADAGYGKIAQTADLVTIGTADRIRYFHPRAVFVFGAAEGKFPALTSHDGLIGDRERAFLSERGVKIADHGEKAYADERFFAYTALAAPSERLFVSFPQTDGDGRVQSPSVIVTQLQRILPGVKLLTPQTVDRSLFLQTPRAAVRAYALSDDETEKRVIEQTDAEEVRRLRDGAGEKDFAMHDPSLSERLYGKDLYLSPSKVEDFYACRFAYFCRRGLRVRPLKRAQMNPLQSGTFIHYCLQHLLADNGRDAFCALSETEIAAQCDRLTENYVHEELGDAMPDARFMTLLLRLKESVRRLALRLKAELLHSSFTPVEFEVPVSRDGEIKPICLALSDGGSVCVEGTADRIDTFEKDGVRYLRVIDYKSGGKTFNLDDVEAGLKIQMLLYLFAACAPQGGKYAGSIPAGVLYVPAGDSYLKTDRREKAESIDKAQKESLRANGLILDNPTVIEAMENGKDTHFIPVYYKTDGSFTAKSSLADAETFGKIGETVCEVLTRMGELLHQGDTVPDPNPRSNACEYCDYAFVCKRAEKTEESTES